MKDQKNAGSVQMQRIRDFLVQDILEMSDEEVLAEAKENNIDVKAEATHISAIIHDALFIHGQSRLQAAKKAYMEKKQIKESVLNITSLERKKQIINSINTNDNLRKKITMAARSEDSLSETDIDLYLQSLVSLGVIDEEGNLICD